MPLNEIHKILSSFEPVGLAEMDNVSLMNRVETKYVFSSGKLPDILGLLSANYKILEISSIRCFPYNTTYLDTPDFLFYTQQVRGKLNRHKIRYRIYETMGSSYLEIKKRTNKNRTIKWRIENVLTNNAPDINASAFIKEYLPYDLPDLRPVVKNGFNRITLVGKEFRERVTLDYDITFESYNGRRSEIPWLAIAELKRERHFSRSPLGNIMKQNGIKPNSFSKYCIGSTLTMEMPRMNTLKRNLMLINKIEHEYLQST